MSQVVESGHMTDIHGPRSAIERQARKVQQPSSHKISHNCSHLAMPPHKLFDYTIIFPVLGSNFEDIACMRKLLATRMAA